MQNGRPLFTAVSASTKQIFHLLRTVNFNAKAQVKITSDGIRFSVEEARVMQGVAFLDRNLFNSFKIATSDDAGAADDSQDEDLDIPPFEISLTSLLETLQIFGINETVRKERFGSNTMPSRYEAPVGPFERRNVLGISGLCRMTYAAMGDPFQIHLDVAGVSTNCELTTYVTNDQDEIPLQKDAIAQKIIMRSWWLHDAMQEVASTQPTRLTFTASPKAPHFAIAASGPLGSMTIDFNKEADDLLETFQVRAATSNTYNYQMIKGASRAMASANKVSIRTDAQGVLSLQFMIEMEDVDGHEREKVVSFVDFRFVPLVDDEEDGEG